MFFYLLSAIIIAGSVLTVTTNNILRAAIYLLFVLGATAGIYFMMNFNFLAAVQLTVYAGGVVVLIIFSILLTHQINTQLEKSSVGKRLIAAGISLIVGSIFIYPILNNPWTSIENSGAQEMDTSMNTIGEQLMSFTDNGYVLPFEVISVLLLAAMIAAIIIAKKFAND